MVAHNLAKLNGGGFYINLNSSAKFNCTIITFLNNTSLGDGGGIYAETLNTFIITVSSLNFV